MANRKGQVIVEYLLLMVLVVALSTMLTKVLVGRSDSNSGLIIKAWASMIKQIGNDIPDCPNQTDFSTANCP